MTARGQEGCLVGLGGREKYRTGEDLSSVFEASTQARDTFAETRTSQEPPLKLAETLSRFLPPDPAVTGGAKRQHNAGGGGAVRRAAMIPGSD